MLHVAIFPTAFRVTHEAVSFGVGNPAAMKLSENIISMQLMPNTKRRYVDLSPFGDRNVTTIINVDPIRETIPPVIDNARAAVILGSLSIIPDSLSIDIIAGAQSLSGR